MKVYIKPKLGVLTQFEMFYLKIKHLRITNGVCINNGTKFKFKYFKK